MNTEITKVPTAKEFFENYAWTIDSCEAAMIQFARLHVKAALATAATEALTKDVKLSNDVEVDKDSILTAYPESLIK